MLEARIVCREEQLLPGCVSFSITQEGSGKGHARARARRVQCDRPLEHITTRGTITSQYGRKIDQYAAPGGERTG